jgi:predicted DNA-binding mobile mystery protein A
MKDRKLLLKQLDDKIQILSTLRDVAMPPSGWIRAIRTALGMTLEQLGNKLGITRQSVGEIETREADGSITLNSLRDVAHAMDLQLVYGFIPNDGSLDALVERKAKEIATQIVMRTSNTMKLEDQEISKQRFLQAVEEKCRELKNEIPKYLWD